MSQKLTEGSAGKLKLPAGADEVYAWDSVVPGFGIRRRKGGSLVYVVKYRIGAQQRKITLGSVVPGMLAEMREMAATVIAKAKLGQDVQGDRRAAAQVRQAVTVGTLIERYLEMRRDQLKPRTFIEVKRYLLRQAKSLHGLAIEAVTRRVLAPLIDDIADTSGRTAADRLKASLSTFFGWCVERDYIDANPAIGIKRRATGGSRERVLSETELVAIWETCNEDDHGLIVRLLMLTGQRRDEFGSLAWDEVDFDKCQIVLPGNQPGKPGRTKNGREHIVPLSNVAIAILRAIPRRGNRKLVFGRGKGGFSGWSRSKARLDKRLGDKVKPWTLHDLRRSFATLAAEHDMAAPHIIEAMLNHWSGSKTGIAGVYNRSSHERGKKQLADRYGDFITALVGGAGIERCLAPGAGISRRHL
jgi:integrase